METNTAKSDAMICNSTSYNAFYWKKYNDLMFIKQMDMPQNVDSIDRCIEDKLQMTESRECEVSDRIYKRGGNAECYEPQHFCKGFDCYNNYHLSDFLITPCPINTWKNSLISNKDMGCTKRHQFYANVTKRR